MLIQATLVNQLRVRKKQLREQQLLEPPLTGRPFEASQTYFLQQSAQLLSLVLALQYIKNFAWSDTHFSGAHEARVWSQYKFLIPISHMPFCEA